MSDSDQPEDRGDNEPAVTGNRAPPRCWAAGLRRIRKSQVQSMRGSVPAHSFSPCIRAVEPDGVSGDTPGKERLADRLVKLARLRRQEDDERARRAAAPSYTVSEAIPLERLGFMGLMLRPPPRIITEIRDIAVAPASSPVPIQATQSQTGYNETAADIAVLMAEYATRAPLPARAEAACEPETATGPASQALALALPLSSPSFGPSDISGVRGGVGRPDVDVLSALDPIKRMAAALQTELPTGSETATASFPNPSTGAMTPDVRLVPAAPLASSSPLHSAAPRDIAVADASPRAVSRPPSAWPSFATGFVIALAFGAGLYIYLAGA